MNSCPASSKVPVVTVPSGPDVVPTILESGKIEV
jgi:hypothetical protein